MDIIISLTHTKAGRTAKVMGELPHLLPIVFVPCGTYGLHTLVPSCSVSSTHPGFIPTPPSIDLWGNDGLVNTKSLVLNQSQASTLFFILLLWADNMTVIRNEKPSPVFNHCLKTCKKGKCG